MKYADDALKDLINKGLKSGIKRAIAAQAVSQGESFQSWLERVRRTGQEIEVVDTELHEPKQRPEKNREKRKFWSRESDRPKRRWDGNKRFGKERFEKRPWQAESSRPQVPREMARERKDLRATPAEKES